MKTKLSNHSDLTGMMFGKLRVERHVTGVANHSGIMWQCRCTCRKYGKRLDVWSYDLLSGRVQDCGCTEKARHRKRIQRRREQRRAEATLQLLGTVCVTLFIRALLKMP
jgi:hypothetical protein